MDFEAAQLLNLSPIPELSEIELSTMLEQLSNLSDLNGDLTDRNVEDILKEAEDLLDNSTSGRYVKSKDKNLVNSCQNKLQSNKTYESTEKNDKIEKESQPPQVFSPVNPVNHIKSTIDSLKEYSNLMEKQINRQSLQSLSISKEKSENKNENHKININLTANDCGNIVESPKSEIRSPDEKVKAQSLSMNESIKLLNCFERLYQNRPRHKKLKTTDKVFVSKKHLKDFKSSVNYNKEKPQTEKKMLGNKVAENVTSKSRHSLSNNKSERKVEDWITKTNNKTVFTYSNQSNKLFQKKSKDDLIVKQIKLKLDSTGDGYHSDIQMVNGKVDDKILFKLLQDIEEIKDQIKISGITSNQHPESLLKESQKISDYLQSELESARLKVVSEENENAAIKRLEEQFFLLKDKYDKQMEKLENENLKLKQSLQRSEQILRLSIEDSDETPAFGTTPKKSTQSPQKLISRCMSCENFQILSNSSQPSTPCKDNLVWTPPTPPKEAYSQTEKELRNTSTQCVEEGNQKINFKVENKENLSQKKKFGKNKPFSDIYQLLKQKKTVTEQETQLLATLRGLQTELWEKSKEVRKMKNECEMLKSQIKRLGKNKIEGFKKMNNKGTQTIGLGPALQIYNPQLYQEHNDFEQENKELKARIKILEKNAEVLKEKRVLDLQSLHQVHEEEMGKIVSKLETQSALTKHLHSLLVNR